MQNPALKTAILKALNGRPVSSLTPKKPGIVVTAQPKPTAQAKPDDAAYARFMKDFHGLPGYKHKAQCETIRDRVWPYIVHAPKKPKPERRERPRAIPPECRKLNSD